MIQSMLKVMGVTVVFALVHSGLASLAAKERAARLFGRRHRNGLYRIFFNIQAMLTLAALWAAVHPLPEKTLYHIRGPLAGLMRFGQLAGLLYAIYTAYLVGIGRITGLQSLAAWMTGADTVPPEPEAQGPSPGEQGRLQVEGTFNLSRHPLNFAPLPVFWLNPKMTAKLLAYNIIASLYLVLGSVHEETRLAEAYGERYREYQHSRIPFYLPLGRSRARQVEEVL